MESLTAIPQGEGKGDRELWTTKEYADFELWVDWRIKESPYVNTKARIILPDGPYQKDDSGNVMTVAASNTDSGVFLRGQHKSQVNIWCWPVGSGEVWGYRTDPAFDAKVHAGVTPKVKADKPIGEWNTFHITLKGDRLTVTLNDRLIIDDAPSYLASHAKDHWPCSCIQNGRTANGVPLWCSFATYVSSSLWKGSSVGAFVCVEFCGSRAWMKVLQMHRDRIGKRAIPLYTRLYTDGH